MSLLSAVLVAFGFLQVAGIDVYKAPDRSQRIEVPEEKDINNSPWWHNCP